MPPGRWTASFLSLLLGLAPGLAHANTVRIQINLGGSAQVGSGVSAVNLPASMPVGGSTLRVAPPSSVLTQSLGEVRIRGVQVAPLQATAKPLARRRGLAEAKRATPEQSAQEAEALSLTGKVADGANLLAKGITSAQQQGGGLRLRETIGAVFEGSDRIVPQEVDVVAAPVTQDELFGDAKSGLVVGTKEAERLTKHADNTARLRGLRATKGEAALAAEDAAVLRGIDDLARAIAIGRSSPAELAAAARVVEGMDIAVLRRFSELAGRFINTDVPVKSSPFARVGNVEHVEQQLIEPLAEDGKHLAWAFKGNRRQTEQHFVEMLKALQYATDAGKQQVPDDMKAALMRFSPLGETGPNWYINNFILPHEYASMQWVQVLGREAGMKGPELLAFQRLIANHNFGPDLTNPKNAKMREHWWPKNFRQNMLPMFRAMGIDVEPYFSRDEQGVLQYNHALGHVYPMLLAAYDRAIAVGQRNGKGGNGNGLATWKKYGIQDFNGKKGRLKSLREGNAKRDEGELLEADPPGAKDQSGKAGAIFEFDGPSVVTAMYSAADWAEQHVDSLWQSLYEAAPANGRLRSRYPTLAPATYTPDRAAPEPASFVSFPPFSAQRQSIGALLGVLRLTEAANPQGATNRADILPRAGVAYYEAQSAPLAGVYRVTLERTGPGATSPRSTDYAYEARIDVYRSGSWTPAVLPAPPTTGPDPVALLLDLIRKDQNW